MSDGRFQVVEHNGIPCLRVMIDTDDERPIARTHIPLDDIEAAVAHKFGQELAQKILAIKEKAEEEVNKHWESDWASILSGALDDIETLCKEQLEKEGETNHG